jgi:hypothetical protein
VQQWLAIIEKKQGLHFNYQTAETFYFTYLKGKAETVVDPGYSKSLEQIMKDLERTFPGQKHFQRSSKGTIGITQIRNLLRAAARCFSETGYVQGMNFIVGALLFHSCEVAAFWLFNILWTRYNVGEVYASQLRGLHLHCQVMNKLIEAKYPVIWGKMVHDVAIK